MPEPIAPATAAAPPAVDCHDPVAATHSKLVALASAAAAAECALPRPGPCPPSMAPSSTTSSSPLFGASVKANGHDVSVEAHVDTFVLGILDSVVEAVESPAGEPSTVPSAEEIARRLCDLALVQATTGMASMMDGAIEGTATITMTPVHALVTPASPPPPPSSDLAAPCSDGEEEADVVASTTDNSARSTPSSLGDKTATPPQQVADERIDNDDADSEADWKEQNAMLMSTIKEIYDGYEAENGLLKSQFHSVVEACGLSPYFGSAFWRYLTEDWVDDQVPNRGLRVTRLKRLPYERFVKSWTALIERHPDDETGFVFALLKGTRPGLATLSGESFEAVVEDVVLNHRELNFLHGNTVFQRLYIETVITRIFYTAARTLPPLEEDAASGKAKGLSYAQFRKSGFVDILKNLGDSEINDERLYFSYKHFYVSYCKFYDLDALTNLCIDGRQLLGYGNGTINQYVCERVAQGCGLPYQWRSADKGKYRLRPYYYGSSGSDRGESGLGLGLTDEQSVNGPRIVGQMSYVEILWFILSEEDRTSLTAIEYWFRVLDLDDDGVLSLFELEQLWECQEQRLAKEGCTSFDFRDIICVALDLVKTQPSPNFYAPPSSIVNWTSIPPESDIHFTCVPTSSLTIRLADLRKSPPLAARFYDYFINVTKFLERENTNGNRLIREIDEAQQMFLQQQQFLGLTGSTCIVSPDEIPTDNLTPFARWADAEYDHYIRMEEVDSQKELQQQSLLQHYAMDEYPVAISEDSAAAGIDGADVDAAGVRRAIATATKTWKRNRIRLRRTWVNRKKARSHSGEDDDEDEGNFEDIDGDYDSDEEEDDDDEEDDEGAYAELIAEPQFRDIVAVTLSETPDEESLDEEELVARMQLQRLVGKSDQTMPATAAADVSCADLTEELPQVAPVAAAPLSSSPNSAFIAPLGTLFNEHPGHVSRLQSSSPPRSPPCIGGRMAPGRGAGSPTKMNAPVFTAADDDDENDDGAASEDPHLQISETIADID